MIRTLSVIGASWTLTFTSICTLAQQTISSDPEVIFQNYKHNSLTTEHNGNSKQELRDVQNVLSSLSKLPPYCDHISELRVRLSILLLKNRMYTECFDQANKLIKNSAQISANAGRDGELLLEIGYLKDGLLSYAQEQKDKFAKEQNEITAVELAHKICQNFKQLRCHPRDTLTPLCEAYIRHKKYHELEKSAAELLTLSDNPLTQMTSLAMLELSYRQQGKFKEAKAAQDKIAKLDPRTDANERVWQRDMALLHKSILDDTKALKEINAALSMDDKLPESSKSSQIATDLGIKADIELDSNNVNGAVNDARSADKTWAHCDPSIWKGPLARTFVKSRSDDLATLETALHKMHRNKEADEARASRRQILYFR